MVAKYVQYCSPGAQLNLAFVTIQLPTRGVKRQPYSRDAGSMCFLVPVFACEFQSQKCLLCNSQWFSKCMTRRLLSLLVLSYHSKSPSHFLCLSWVKFELYKSHAKINTKRQIKANIDILQQFQQKYLLAIICLRKSKNRLLLSDWSFSHCYYIGKPVKPWGTDSMASVTNLNSLHREKKDECSSSKITISSQVMWVT